MITGSDIGRGDTVAGFDERLVAQAVARACSPGFDAWWQRVVGSGFCARPVQLLGIDNAGALTRVFSRCKNRRAAVCPSCSDIYAGDTWQLMHAGIAGGHHGMPAAVAEHPAVFVTLTAPGFGPVHGHHDGVSGKARKCHSDEGFRRCVHGRPLWCGAVHAADDPVVGEPLCGDCYDYTSHALFAWWAPELWRRFTIALRRQVASAMRAGGGDAAGVRVAFVKVVEFQRRGVPHFHAVIRLDGPLGLDGQPSTPDACIDAGMLAALVHQAAARVVIGVPGPHDSTVTMRFGDQIDGQPLTAGGSGETFGTARDSSDGVDVRCSPRRVAAYLAKYVCKSVAEFGLSPARMSPLAIDTLDVRDHIRAILRALSELSVLPGYAPMLRWLHNLGYRGHVVTKSRRFSTTLAALRARRATWCRQHRTGFEPVWPTSGTEGRSDRSQGGGDASMEWTVQRVGHVCDGDRWLAVSAAARAREHRIIARAEYVDLIAAGTDWAAA